MRFHLASNEASAAIWSGVALTTLYALEKVFWVLLPTGLLTAYSSADGWQLPEVSKNLAFFRDMTSEVLKVPTWYLEYGYLYGIISAAAWLWIAVILALRKSYALRALLIFSAFSIIHAIAISFAVLVATLLFLGKQWASTFYWQSSLPGQLFVRSMCNGTLNLSLNRTPAGGLSPARRSPVIVALAMPDALIWPAVALIAAVVIGIVAIFALRPGLLRLLDRTKRIGRDGAVFDRTQEPENPPAPALSFDELVKLPVSATVLNREEIIKRNLQAIPLRNDADKIAILIKASAVSRVEMEFINISNLIFGSQLTLLVRLSGTRVGVTHADADTIFKQAQADFPQIHGSRTLDEWLRYLVTSDLITTQNNRIDISQYGTDFLKYLVDAHLAYARHG